jgi:hypothetical protein
MKLPGLRQPVLVGHFALMLDVRPTDEGGELVLRVQTGVLSDSTLVGGDGKHSGVMVTVAEFRRAMPEFAQEARRMLGLAGIGADAGAD